jgi:cytochrome b involved in lipid metabolism
MSLKKATLIALVIFWGFVLILGVLAFRQSGTERQETSGEYTDSSIPWISNATSSNGTLAGKLTALSVPEISKHNSSSDCWLIISGNVYNVTSFIPIHPGGSREIISYCGKDGTVAFQTQGGRGGHSNTAISLLPKYLIGKVGDNISQNTIDAKSAASSAESNTIAPTLRSEREFDDD